MLNNSGESGQSCLDPDIRGNAFSFSPIENNVCCGFVIDGLNYVELDSFYVHFLENFFFF